MPAIDDKALQALRDENARLRLHVGEAEAASQRVREARTLREENAHLTARLHMLLKDLD